MERLSRSKKSTINGNALRTWGLLFLAAGVIGRGVIQTHILGIGQVTTQQLLQIMGSSETVMKLSTLSLILQALETCAAPIFALFLVEGLQHTSDFKAYFLRVASLAVLTELPFNLAIGGKLLAMNSRNPVFGLVLCMILVWFYRTYAASGIRNLLIKAAVTAAAVVWCQMLKIEFGSATVLMVAVMWWFRKNTLYRNFAGATAAIVCSVFSPFFLAAPMCFLVVHAYDGEKSTTSRRVSYLAYPCILMAAAIAGFIL